MRPLSRPVRLPVLLALALGCPIARADIIHLKNGALITADSWEEAGDHLIVHQAGGRITIPRSQVDHIEPQAPAPQAPPEAASAPPSAPQRSPSAAAGASSLSDEQLARAIEDLKRRIVDYPLAREANTRRLAGLLVEAGARSLRGRDYDAALARFREALACDAKDVRAQLGEATVYARTDQDILARSTLERALLDHPDDPDLHALLGDVYNGQERTEEALAEWRKAYEKKPSASLQGKIDKLSRERSIDETYRQSEAAHFTLKYDGERAGPDLGGQIVSYLEEQFRVLENRFDYTPLQPIVVILYPQRQFFEATQADANVLGLYDGKIRVPIGGLQQIDLPSRRVLLHELAHAFIAGKSRGTASRWLHEGIAQLLEGKKTPTPTGVSLAHDYQGLENKEAWGKSFTYPSALSFVEYLDGRLGFPVLVDVLKSMASGLSEDEAFEQTTRYSLKELRQGWGDALADKYLH